MAYTHTFSGQNEPKSFKPCSDRGCFGSRMTMNPNPHSPTSQKFPYVFTTPFAVLRDYSTLYPISVDLLESRIVLFW